MARDYGGIWIRCDDLRSRIDRLLLNQGQSFSLHLDSTTVVAGSSCLALISRKPATFDYIAMATVGTQSGTLERRVVFGPAVQFSTPLEFERVLQELPSRLRRYLSPPNGRVVSIPPATWAALLSEIGRHARENQNAIKELAALVEVRKRSRRQSLPPIVSYERDATAIALEIFGGSRRRKKHLENLEIDSQAPFISSLGQTGANLLEDQMIAYDLEIFPGAELVKRYAVGAAQFASDTGSLTVVNANKNGIERTLGVDLVYYHHIFRSFVLVQYKRLTGKPNSVYRPRSDPSYASEMERMVQFRATKSARQLSDLLSYRLDDNEFYLKFCSSTQAGFWSRMLSGMYIPLRLWELFISSPDARGPRGGLVVGYRNMHRRLSNSEFASLVRSGWIGSATTDSERIREIVERELSADRSLMVAIHNDSRSSEDYLRNPLGQFAAADEPDTL